MGSAHLLYLVVQLICNYWSWIYKWAELADSLIHVIYSYCAVHVYRCITGIKGVLLLVSDITQNHHVFLKTHFVIYTINHIPFTKNVVPTTLNICWTWVTPSALCGDHSLLASPTLGVTLFFWDAMMQIYTGQPGFSHTEMESFSRIHQTLSCNHKNCTDVMNDCLEKVVVPRSLRQGLSWYETHIQICFYH